MRAFERRSYQIWWRPIRVWQTWHSITSNFPLHKHTTECFFTKFPSQSATDLYDHHNILIKLCLSPFGSSRLGSYSQRSVCWNTFLLCLCQTADITPANCLDLLSSCLLLFSLALLVFFFPLLLFSVINSLLITHFSLTIFRSCYFCYFCTIHTHTLYKQMDFRGIVHLKIKTLSVFTHPNVVPTSYNFFSPLNKKGEILNNVMVALFHTTTRNETGV